MDKNEELDRSEKDVDRALSDAGRFLIYCIERYRFVKGLSGKETIDLFEKYDVVSYLMEYHNAFHSTGDACLAADIDEYIAARS